MCLWNSLCFLSEIFAWIFSRRSLKSPVSQPKKKASTSTTSPQSAGFCCLEEAAFRWVPYHPSKEKTTTPRSKTWFGSMFLLFQGGSFSFKMLGLRWMHYYTANPSKIAIYFCCLIHPILGFVKMTPEIYQTPNPPERRPWPVVWLEDKVLAMEAPPSQGDQSLVDVFHRSCEDTWVPKNPTSVENDVRLKGQIQGESWMLESTKMVSSFFKNCICLRKKQGIMTSLRSAKTINKPLITYWRGCFNERLLPKLRPLIKCLLKSAIVMVILSWKLTYPPKRDYFNRKLHLPTINFQRIMLVFVVICLDAKKGRRKHKAQGYLVILTACDGQGCALRWRVWRFRKNLNLHLQLTTVFLGGV